jgi:hypothetical protein
LISGYAIAKAVGITVFLKRFFYVKEINESIKAGNGGIMMATKV